MTVVLCVTLTEVKLRGAEPEIVDWPIARAALTEDWAVDYKVSRLPAVEAPPLPETALSFRLSELGPAQLHRLLISSRKRKAALI